MSDSALLHPPRRRGRPSTRSEEKLLHLCTVLRLTGCSDSEAAERIGFSPASISRWKRAQPAIVLRLDQARAEFILDRLSVIRESRHRDGRLVWRAQVWLLQHLYPGNYSKPATIRLRRRRDSEPDCPTLWPDDPEAAVPPSPEPVEPPPASEASPQAPAPTPPSPGPANYANETLPKPENYSEPHLHNYPFNGDYPDDQEDDDPLWPDMPGMDAGG